MSTEAVYIPVGELAAGFAPHGDLLSHVPPLRQSLMLHFSDGSSIFCNFPTDDTLEWDHHPAVACRITSLREGIEFIDFPDAQHRNSTLTLICDHQRACFTLVAGQLPNEQQTRVSAFSRIEQALPLTGVTVTLRHGLLNSPCNSASTLHGLSDELVGMRNQYRYNPTECYEHIYLNSGLYTWHCLEGVEQGLADVDRCQTVKIGKQLYLFIWQEKIIPTLGVILIDLIQLRTDGKIFGYQQHDCREVNNFAVGAQATILNVTRHACER